MAKKSVVFLTGVSSFTGAHIGRACKEAGFELHVSLSANLTQYSGIKKTRIDYAHADFTHEGIQFGSEAFLNLIKDIKPNVFINHGAWMEGYRSPDFKFQEAFVRSTENVRKVFETLASNGLGRLVHTGSFFEPGEGDPELGSLSPAVSIYGATKAATWNVLKYWAESFSIPVSKIVIPNPVGPMENEDRLGPVFLKHWREGKTPELRVCSAVRDNLPVQWLANVYAREIARSDGGSQVVRPSGFVSSQRDYVAQYSQALERLLAMTCPVRYNETTPDPLALRVNVEPVPELVDANAVASFWKSLV